MLGIVPGYDLMWCAMVKIIIHFVNITESRNVCSQPYAHWIGFYPSTKYRSHTSFLTEIERANGKLREKDASVEVVPSISSSRNISRAIKKLNILSDEYDNSHTKTKKKKTYIMEKKRSGAMIAIYKIDDCYFDTQIYVPTLLDFVLLFIQFMIILSRSFFSLIIPTCVYTTQHTTTIWSTTKFPVQNKYKKNVTCHSIVQCQQLFVQHKCEWLETMRKVSGILYLNQIEFYNDMN